MLKWVFTGTQRIVKQTVISVSTGITKAPKQYLRFLPILVLSHLLRREKKSGMHLVYPTIGLWYSIWILIRSFKIMFDMFICLFVGT